MILSLRHATPCLLFFTGSLLSVTLFSGCSVTPHSDKATGQVVVKVTFGGEAVTEGLVNFASPQTGLGGAAPLTADGTATITAIPVGEYVVTVTPPPPDLGNPNPPTVDYPRLPKKFRSETTSTLKATVSEGKNQVEFDLKK